MHLLDPVHGLPVSTYTLNSLRRLITLLTITHFYLNLNPDFCFLSSRFFQPFLDLIWISPRHIKLTGLSWPSLHFYPNLLLPCSPLPCLLRFLPSPVFPKCHLPRHTHSHIPAKLPNLISSLVYFSSYYLSPPNISHIFLILFVAYLPFLKCKLMKTII